MHKGFSFNHFNFNVLDLERSKIFYHDALELDLSVSMTSRNLRSAIWGDHRTEFRLELTWMKERKEPYDLGEIEYHLALTADDFEARIGNIRRWIASALRIRRWAFTSLKIRMATGLKYAAGKIKRYFLLKTAESDFHFWFSSLLLYEMPE